MKNNSTMEPFWVFLCTCFLILSTMSGPVKASLQFEVGDHEGWQQPADNNTAPYSRWATSKRFQVGDSLYFEYENDSVLVVNKWDYYHCNKNNPFFSFKDGNTLIFLDRPGLFYFISGNVDHCKKGQKLVIWVMGLHQKAESSPPMAASPDYHQDMAPAKSHPSSGLLVTVTLSSVFVALLFTIITLV